MITKCMLSSPSPLISSISNGGMSPPVGGGGGGVAAATAAAHHVSGVLIVNGGGSSSVNGDSASSTCGSEYSDSGSSSSSASLTVDDLTSGAGVGGLLGLPGVVAVGTRGGGRLRVASRMASPSHASLGSEGSEVSGLMTLLEERDVDDSMGKDLVTNIL